VPAGATARIAVAEFTVKRASLEPNLTPVAPAKPVPVIATTVPPLGAPALGWTFVTVGALAACAEAGGANTLATTVAAANHLPRLDTLTDRGPCQTGATKESSSMSISSISLRVVA
jgi:hypothetical protein